ncbi:MAG: hypothetical protein G01um10147_631 [Microgenomates group bacterium Gr01-1014_7]|nr:MAG: hypothetical protein G01um10147_631 [Microgenomates group bacterium Gr01-1014_7]
MSEQNKAKAIILIEKHRLIEAELFRLTSRYGVKTTDDLDKLLYKGKLSEETVGEDFFLFDHLLSEKTKIEKELRKLKLKKANLWQNLQDLLELPKLNFRV